jgi:hypothetical protein
MARTGDSVLRSDDGDLRLGVTFAAVDWVMTMEPHWFSTIFGLLFVIGWALSCLCFVVIVLTFLTTRFRWITCSADGIFTISEN